MDLDVLVAEIGSTTTVVNGFSHMESNPKFIGQGQAATTVLNGDVTVGLKQAIESLKRNIGAENIEYKRFLATSSAAGGLKMTVHGLVYDMTAKAAKEAALGAGAIIHMVTAGKMRKNDIKKLEIINPNIILLAGGLDYGERDTVLYNAQLIEELELNIPIIYAGNCENHEEIKDIFKENIGNLYIVENVYPKVDILNVEPTRAVIQQVFEKHIVHAPGMQKVRSLVNGTIIPTPGAVMEAAKLLKNHIGDLVVIDVGGATTDVHSVTEGSEEIQRILLSPEPEAKRTVEGDLGMFINMENVVKRIGEENLAKELDMDISYFMKNPKPIPETKQEIKFTERLCLEAVITAISRHAGSLRYMYGSSGRKSLAEGKDLTQVKYIIGTGGALTRLPNRVSIMKQIALVAKSNQLFPKIEAEILVDEEYIMASLGVLSKEYAEAALQLTMHSLKLL